MWWFARRVRRVIRLVVLALIVIVICAFAWSVHASENTQAEYTEQQ